MSRIADLRQQGVSIRGLAAELGRAAATVSRQLRRDGQTGDGNGPTEARRRSTARRAKPPAASGVSTGAAPAGTESASP